MAQTFQKPVESRHKLLSAQIPSDVQKCLDRLLADRGVGPLLLRGFGPLRRGGPDRSRLKLGFFRIDREIEREPERPHCF